MAIKIPHLVLISSNCIIQYYNSIYCESGFALSMVELNTYRYLIYIFFTRLAVMDDSSNSPRGDDCGEGEEEEDQEKGTSEKESASTRLSIEGSSGTNLPR